MGRPSKGLRGLRWGLWVTCASHLGWMVACGSSSDDSQSVPKDELANRVLHAMCDHAKECCDAASLPFDARRCQDRAKTLFAQRLAIDSLIYDAKQAGACIDDLTAAARSCASLAAPSCNTVFAGPVPPGGACSQSMECARGDAPFADCVHPDLGSPGTGHCVLPGHGKAGDLCQYSCFPVGGVQHCPIELDPSGMSGGGQSTICYASDGLLCGGSDGTAPSTCVRSGSANNRCEPNRGAPCSGEGEVCSASNECVPGVARGGACASSEECGNGAYCSGGSCAARKTIGAACSDSSECASERCAEGVCAASSPASAQVCAVGAPP